MKTRIVYPQLWLDENFAQCKVETKLLFMYLITNQYLGLSRYSRIANRKIVFDTGLNTVQIDKAKKELEKLRWCFFKDEWIYHKHECAYVDYVRNDRVAESKEKEINCVPDEIVRYFNESCLNNVQTVLELKSETINHKSETINKKQENSFSSIDDLTAEVIKDIAEQYSVDYSAVAREKESMSLYCKANGKKYKDYKAALQNWIRRKIDDKKLISKGIVKSRAAEILAQKERQYGNN